MRYRTNRRAGDDMAKEHYLAYLDEAV